MSTASKEKHLINMIFIVVFVQCLLLIMGNVAYAQPYLQLDADPAIYVGPPEESTVTTSDVFTLYALVNSKDSEAPDPIDLLKEYYLSIAIVPKVVTPTVLGSFTIDGPGISSLPDNIINVTAEMQYGIPPVVATIAQDIPSHGIYETYFIEIPFTLTGAKQAGLYDVQTQPGLPDPDSIDQRLYYQEWAVDATGLSDDHFLHFDLYTNSTKKPGSINFAPPSHDVTHTPVPGALLLGMLGMSVAGMKLRKYA